MSTLQRLSFSPLFAIVALSLSMTASAQTQYVILKQAELRGSLHGFGEGVAAAISLHKKPTKVELIDSSVANGSRLERRIYIRAGLKVTVIGEKNGSVTTPVTVEVTSTTAIRKLSKSLSEITRSSVVPNFGTPISQSVFSVRYRGPTESCDEFIDLGFKGEVLASVKWSFCSE